MSIELSDAYDNVNEAFNVDYVLEPTIDELNAELSEGNPELSKELLNIEQEITSLQTVGVDVNMAQIKDAGFLEREMKSMLVSSRKVLETLEKEIKIGANARMYEVYGGLVGSITAQFKELRNLNESVAKFVIENKKQNLEEVKEDHKMMLSSNDALDLYMKAKSSSQMGAIDADFDVVDNQ